MASYGTNAVDNRLVGAIPPSGPLWPRGLALQDRPHPPDDCSCPNRAVWFPCSVLCCGFPLWFVEATNENPRASEKESPVYLNYCPPCCGGWRSDADVLGVPLRFEGEECGSNCCMPAISVYDTAHGGHRFIGKTEMNCVCCMCCGEQVLAKAVDANGQERFKRTANACCGFVTNYRVKKSCCSCWNTWSWPVKDAANQSSHVAAITERIHCCSFCYPWQLAYGPNSMQHTTLSADDQKLLAAFLMSMWWRGHMVRAQDQDDFAANQPLMD